MRVVLAGAALYALTSTTALAADPAAVLQDNVDPARFGWDGAYIGLTVGYSWLEDVTNTPFGPIPDEGKDWVFGGFAGYQAQFGHVVVGAEIEALRLDIDFETASFITVNNAFVPKVRAGVALDRFLITGHLGAAYATSNIDLKDWGLAVGGGVDYAITDNVIVGAQYSHFEFEEFDGQPIDAKLDTVSARFSYKF